MVNTCMLRPLFALSLLSLVASAQSRKTAYAANDRSSQPATAGQIRVPDRASTPMFKGEQGKQGTEIHFDPATGMVTIKLLVQDPNGYFIPNLRRDNFVVYENGVRQNNATVEIEHAPVSLGVLIEWGGRYPGLNKVLAADASISARQLLEVTGREDKIALLKYADRPELVTDFTQDHEKLNDLFYKLDPPGVSEANLYDAIVAVLQRMQGVSGRKAVILISSGIDTFSKARYEDVLKEARAANTPVYAISLAEILRETAELPGIVAPSARFDWKRAEHELQEIARTSGGRFYSPTTTVDLSAIYDDIMENLKVRYVITYKSSTEGDLNSPRTVRVELVNPKTGGPLQIVDASGKTIHAHVVVEDSYVPSKAAGAQARIPTNHDWELEALIPVLVNLQI
jgi:Ca-activated chloride channel family protein